MVLFDYAAIEDYNASSEYGSALVMSESKNEHVWYGLLSTYTTKFGENFDFMVVWIFVITKVRILM